MPNPKRRFSKTRTATAAAPRRPLAYAERVDSATGATHLRHRAHWEGDKLLLQGPAVVDKTASE
ncbi:MAG: 50S ribosomal protein L32 [Flavobacteriales bacterium]|nr:50S ribosomal protein L32 [Flavobacteriales bacterium]